MDPALRRKPSNYINGRFVEIPGDALRSHDPAAPDRVIWRGAPDPGHAEAAVDAAKHAFESWAALSIEDRAAHLRRYQQVVRDSAQRLAGLITDEMGKTLAESRDEVTAVAAKVDITLDPVSLGRVSPYEVKVSGSRCGRCRFKPHGVMAVIGPFNFPAHLPNGHFVPALLLGNTVVLKPSERTPAVGQLLAELMHEAALPPGVFNVIQGGPAVAQRLVGSETVAGILFTGSWPVGRRILEANLDRPGRILALEMGGNNASVVMADCDLRQAVIECARSAFATTGQRCTCTRRIIVEHGAASRFIPAFCKATSNLLIGPGRSATPVFMGPVASRAAADAVLAFQQELGRAGGNVLVESALMDRPGHFVSPSVVEVGGFPSETDREIFGPLVQIAIASGLDQAIELADATNYGLAASIFTADQDAADTFFRRVHAGCINQNTGTAGASSKLPFGGLRHSGNHRPAGAFSVDYCAYPVANMVERGSETPAPAGMRWDDRWL